MLWQLQESKYLRYMCACRLSILITSNDVCYGVATMSTFWSTYHHFKSSVGLSMHHSGISWNSFLSCIFFWDAYYKQEIITIVFFWVNRPHCHLIIVTHVQWTMNWWCSIINDQDWQSGCFSDDCFIKMCWLNTTHSCDISNVSIVN